MTPTIATLAIYAVGFIACAVYRLGRDTGPNDQPPAYVSGQYPEGPNWAGWTLLFVTEIAVCCFWPIALAVWMTKCHPVHVVAAFISGLVVGTLMLGFAYANHWIP